MSESIDLDAYFARIGYDGPWEPSLEALAGIHARHPMAIPFENLDPLTGRTPSLEVGALQAKLVTGGRGGYCFEQNGLLQAVLETLDFRLDALAARVMWGAPADAPPRPRTHKLLRVHLADGDVLADVGFGGLVLTAPLRFEPHLEQDTGHGVFRLVPVEAELQLQVLTPNGWAAMYQLSDEPQLKADYDMANWFVSTRPDSFFTTDLVCARARPDRRLGLLNGELSVRFKDGRVEKRRLDAEGLGLALVADFGLPRAVVASPKVRAALRRVAATVPA